MTGPASPRMIRRGHLQSWPKSILVTYARNLGNLGGINPLEAWSKDDLITQILDTEPLAAEVRSIPDASLGAASTTHNPPPGEQGDNR